MQRYPIVIVGSGPAGAATALSLHGRNPALARDTLILEKARHPRPKICAGGVIPAAVRWLHLHGIELTVPHVTVHSALVSTPTTTVEHEDRDLCHVVRRAEFDQLLVETCLARGMAVREEEPVLDLQRDDDGVRVETSEGVYHARLVIGADGSGSVVRRRLVDPGKVGMGRAVMGDVPIRDTSWDGFAARRYEFDFRALPRGLRGYRWTFPCLIDGEPHANVGAYSLAPTGSGLDEALAEYAEQLRPEPPRWRAFPIRWYRPNARLAAPHVLLVGDAAGVDPLMGEGISLAFEYGSFAAEAAARAVDSGDFSGAGYQRAVETSWLGRKLRRLHLATRLFYGPTWRLWFGVAEHSRRVRTMGLRWYNGVDDWDRRGAWAAVGAMLRGQT